jgi:hypothetical protein
MRSFLARTLARGRTRCFTWTASGFMLIVASSNFAIAAEFNLICRITQANGPLSYLYLNNGKAYHFLVDDADQFVEDGGPSGSIMYREGVNTWGQRPGYARITANTIEFGLAAGTWVHQTRYHIDRRTGSISIADFNVNSSGDASSATSATGDCHLDNQRNRF